MHLPIHFPKSFVRRVMISFALGSRVSAALPRTSQPSSRSLAAQHLPWTAIGSYRSASTARVLPASLAGWPNVPIHLQRKMLAWSRSPNAEEAVAALPSALSDAPAALGDDVSVPVSGRAAGFSLNGGSSNSGVADAAAAAEGVVAEPAAATRPSAAAAVSTPSVEAAAQAAAEHNGNGVVAAPAASEALVIDAMATDASAAVSSSSSNGTGAGAGPADQGAAAVPEAAATGEPSPPAAQEAVQHAASPPAAAAAAGDSSAAQMHVDSIQTAASEVVVAATEATPTPEAAAAGAAAFLAGAPAAPGSSMSDAASVAAAPTPASAAEAEAAAAAESIASEAAAAAAEAEAQIGMAAASGSDASSTGSDAAPPSSSSSSDGSASSSSSGFGGPALRLVLSSGAAMLPHPDKASRGGEDSFFIADHQAAVGVADGVGGWAEIGVDAGAYARLLMVHAKEAADAAAEEVANGTLSAQAILESAFYRTNVQGSSTACVLVVNGTTLSASNLGDSGFVLVRDGVATFQCPQQQHNFNFPFQLGSADSMSDQPQAAMRFELQLQPGDIIVTGSDGLWDNIFAEEAATIASKCRDKGETATTAAQVLCRYARMRASDAKYHSPFSYAAIQAGYVYLGGKMDDITVVISYVGLPSRV